MESRSFFRFALAAIILVTASALHIKAEETNAAPNFAVYPQTEAFTSLVGGQTNSSWHLSHSNFIAISAFIQGDGTALQYWVSDDGHEFDVRNVYDWAYQASHRKQLSVAEIKNLRAEIAKLPPQSVTPPINQLVIVNFKQGTNWITRSYDSRALPDAMKQIYSIIGERFETKDAPKR